MTEEADRLQDQSITEALGGNTPPDLTARILQAADKPLDEAPTPISGAHAVPRSVRPPARRHTAVVARRNWQGARLAAAFMLVLAIGLIAFMAWKSPGVSLPASTADQPEPKAQPANQNPERQHRDVPAITYPAPEPQPEPDRDDTIKLPEPKPEDTIEQPKPEPKPDDTVEQPTPDPKPDDTVEQPKPESKPDETVEQPKESPDTSEVKPNPELVGLAYVPHDRYLYARNEDEYHYRRSANEDWSSTPPGANPRGTPPSGDIWLFEGWQLKCESGDVYLTNGALLQVEGTLSFHTHAKGLRVELIDDDLYVDNVSASSTVFVSHDGLELEVGQGAAVIEYASEKFSIFCVDGEVSADGKVIKAGFTASLGKRGLSSIKEAGKRDWNHPLITGATPRLLGTEEFDVAPAGNMISGRLVGRTALQLDAKTDGHVAVDTGRNAAIGFGFDGGHTTLRGETVRVRYRATGAEKLVVQLFCPDRNDNFGIDLTPGKTGEWHVIEIRLSDLRDRETHKDAPPPGTNLSSFTIALNGKDNAQLEVDWVEFVREAKFGE